jgi:hypothetical protein
LQECRDPEYGETDEQGSPSCRVRFERVVYLVGRVVGVAAGEL